MSSAELRDLTEAELAALRVHVLSLLARRPELREINRHLEVPA